MYSGSMNGSFTAHYGRCVGVSAPSERSTVSPFVPERNQAERTRYNLNVVRVQGRAEHETANAAEPCDEGQAGTVQNLPSHLPRRSSCDAHHALWSVCRQTSTGIMPQGTRSIKLQQWCATGDSLGPVPRSGRGPSRRRNGPGGRTVDANLDLGCEIQATNPGCGVRPVITAHLRETGERRMAGKGSRQ